MGGSLPALRAPKPSGGPWGRVAVPITLLYSPSMCEDAEQSQLVEASPSMPRIQTPLLGRFLAAASPAISIKNFGRGGRATPHLRRARGDGAFPSPHPEDPEAVDRIEEEETEDEESRGSGPPTPGGPRSPKASEIRRKEPPMVLVKAPSSESVGAERPGGWEP